MDRNGGNEMSNNSQTVLYAGYGAMTEHSGILPALLGRDVKIDTRFTRIPDVQMVVQTLEDIAQPAWGILERKWGDQFQSYAVRPCPGEFVYCTTWLVTPEERETIFEWELGNDGWMQAINTYITSDDGINMIMAQTEGILLKGAYHYVMNSEDSLKPELLMPVEQIIEHAVKIGAELREIA